MTPEQRKRNDEYYISAADCSSLSLEDGTDLDLGLLFPLSPSHIHQINTSSSPSATSTALSLSPHLFPTSRQQANSNSDNDALVENFDIVETMFGTDDTELYEMLSTNLLHFGTASQSGTDLAELHPVSHSNEEAATASSTSTTLSHSNEEAATASNTSTTLSHTPALTPSRVPVSVNTTHKLSRDEDRKERRKRQNREAAKKFRKNQQLQLNNLVKEQASLKQQQVQLVSDVARLQRVRYHYERSLQQHNCVMTDTQKSTKQPANRSCDNNSAD